MKKRPMREQGFILHAMLLATFVLLAADIGLAQDGVKVTIPFNFVVGTESFAAGDYTLTSFSHNAKLLQTPNGKILTIIHLPVAAESREANITPQLVFTQYGGIYFLEQIWGTGNESGRQLTKSSVGIQLARESPAPGRQASLSSVAKR
jgi:hypothetical protein